MHTIMSGNELTAPNETYIDQSLVGDDIIPKCRQRKPGPIFQNPIALTVSTFLAHFLTCGVSYSIGVYYVTFLDVFDESNGVTSWIGSLNTGTLCATGPLASFMIDRIGSRYTVMIGGLLASIGIAVGSFAPNIFVLFVSFGLITGLGYGLVFTCAVVVIGISLREHRSLIMGITISGIGFGNFAYPFLATYLMHAYGWRGALLITSGITLNVCVFGMFMSGGRLPCDVETGKIDESGENKYETNCDKMNDLKPTVIIDKSPSIDRVIMTHSVQSLHLLISKRIFTEANITKANSIEAIANRRLLKYKDADYFSSLQTLTVPGNTVRDVMMIENQLGGKTSDSRSTIGDINRNSEKSQDYFSTAIDGKCTLMDAPGTGHTTAIRHSYVFPFQFYQYWLLQCNTLLFCLSLSVVLTHIFAYSQYQGLNQANATILISINGAANVAGRIGLGALIQEKRIRTLQLFIACYAVAGIACLVMTIWTSFTGLAVCVFCFGFFSAAFGPVLSEVTMEILGVHHFNFGYGFLMISMAMGITLGAPTAGWLYDVTQQYTSSFYLGGASLVVSSVLMLPSLLMRKSQKKTPVEFEEEIDDLEVLG